MNPTRISNKSGMEKSISSDPIEICEKHSGNPPVGSEMRNLLYPNGLGYLAGLGTSPGWI